MFKIEALLINVYDNSITSESSGMPFKMKKMSLITSFLALLLFCAPVQAQDGSGEVLKADFEHFYDNITMDKVSKLYWKVGKFDVNDNEHIDNFLLINECDIYKDYYFNEFEWATVRNKARSFLKENAESFPVRFKYSQPLRLSEYDAVSGQFMIHPDYQIKGYRKFEVVTQDFEEDICTASPKNNIPHYPRILLVELTQPLSLKSIPMSSQLAQEYVQQKMDLFDSLPEAHKNKKNLYHYRDAYIVMKLKMFSYKGDETIVNGWRRSALYGMLEGYEIYADRDHTKLLYFENYIRDDESAKPVNVRLKEQYEALRKRRMGESPDESSGSEDKQDEDNLMNLKQETQ